MEKDDVPEKKSANKEKTVISEEKETNASEPQASTSQGLDNCTHHCKCCQARREARILGSPSTVLEAVSKLSPEQSTLMYLWAKKRVQSEQKRTQSLRAMKPSKTGENLGPRRASIEVLYSPKKGAEDEIKAEDPPPTNDPALGDLEMPLDSWDNMMYVFSRYYQGNLDQLIIHEEDLESEDVPFPPPYPLGTECTCTCQVCYSVVKLHLRWCCQMAVCDECLQQYFSHSVSQGIVKIECPNPECSKFIDRDEIMVRLPLELKDRFYRFLIDANKDPYVKTCPYCSHITHLPKDLHDQINNKFGIKLDCELCHLTWCFPCQAPYHKDISCKDFRKGDKLLKNWAKKFHRGQPNAQKCPKCKVFIQRITGCDHMVCSHCDTNFCYRCGDRYRKFKFIGDHYTRLSIFGCKYRFKPHQPVLRKLIRGSIFGAKIIAAPVLGAGVLAVGAVILVMAGTFVLPCLLPKFAYKRYQFRKQRRLRREQHATLRARLEALGLQAEELEISMPQSHTYHDSIEEDSDSIMTVSNFSDAAPTELYADILTHWHGEDDPATEARGQSDTTSDLDSVGRSEGRDSSVTSEKDGVRSGSPKNEGSRSQSGDSSKTTKETDRSSFKSSSGSVSSGQTNVNGKTDNGPTKTEKQYLETDIDSCLLDKDSSKSDQDKLDKLGKDRLGHSKKSISSNCSSTKAENKPNSSSKELKDTSNENEYANQASQSSANVNQEFNQEQKSDDASVKTEYNGSKTEHELREALKSESKSEKEAQKEQRDQKESQKEAENDQKEAHKLQKEAKKDQREALKDHKEKENQKDQKDSQKGAQKYQKEAQKDQKDSKDTKESQKVDKEPTLKEEIVKVNCTKFFFKLGLVDTESSESVNAETHDDKHQGADSTKLENTNLGTIHTSSYITSL